MEMRTLGAIPCSLQSGIILMPSGKQWLWFIGIWLASVATITVVGLLIKLVL